MEREKELAKLVNVLRRTSRMALQSEWTGSNADAAAFCVEQYNRVLGRLKEIDASVATVFDPLPAGSSLTVAAMACRQLAAYYEDEVGGDRGWGGAWGEARHGVWADKRAFKDFWNKSARELEDLGEYIRENIEDWINQRKRGEKKAEDSQRTTSRIDPEETKPQ
jgi:hypothetical protein